ncbi:MAG: PepSY-associated TM helix domain-containing protein [Bacteroidales bacterium]
MKWRKINRILHRDLGYFFFGMTIIYALSGIALNHLDDWNPSYVITQKNITLESIPEKREKIDRAYALSIAEKFNEKENFKNYYFPEPNQLKIFIENGSIEVNLENREGKIEKSERRPVFYQVNYLHYAPGKWWIYFSDIYAVALIILAITGLFILRGKQGIKGRGAWLTTAGILVPIIFLFVYNQL